MEAFTSTRYQTPRTATMLKRITFQSGTERRKAKPERPGTWNDRDCDKVVSVMSFYLYFLIAARSLALLARGFFPASSPSAVIGFGVSIPIAPAFACSLKNSFTILSSSE
jgi:hypothetical protein